MRARTPPTPTQPVDAVRDRADVARLVTRHQGDVWRYLRHLGCDHAEAEDLTQETFVCLIRTPDFEDRASAATATWLRRIAENLFRNLRRSQRRRLDRATIAATNELWATDEVPTDTRLDALQHCLERLDERSRAIVDAFYRDGVSRQAIAAQHGMKEAGVKTRLQRLRADLRQCIAHRTAQQERHEP